jgi:hypothetical protein
LKGEGAWYARSGGKLQELYTIMHLPYTSMVLSYVLIGAAVSPSFYPSRVISTLLAYFLGLGLSAHALNELHARHWGETLSKRELEILFAAPLVAAVLIGAYGMVFLYSESGGLLPPLVLLVFIFLETFFLFAYNTDLSGGRFHTDISFAFSWAALPVVVSYYVNALTITVVAILVALAMAATAGIEINLSRWCKDFRRKSPLTEMRFADDTKLNLSTAELLAKPEKSLKLIVVAVDLVAIGLTFHKLFS